MCLHITTGIHHGVRITTYTRLLVLGSEIAVVMVIFGTTASPYCWGVLCSLSPCFRLAGNYALPVEFLLMV